MIKAVTVTLSGTSVPLFYNISAMLDITKAHGNGFADKLSDSSREALTVTLDVLEVLNREAELARRRMGYEPQPMIDREQLEADLTPGEWVRAKNAIYAAILAGMEQEVDTSSDEDIDLTLLEYQKKTDRRQ